MDLSVCYFKMFCNLLIFLYKSEVNCALSDQDTERLL